jgi:DNA adenine methylase
VNESERLIELIRTTPVTMETWDQQKKTLRGEIATTTTELGFATFFLSRTNRSGILKGGVIGGRQQNGRYRLTARYNKEALIGRILRIAQHKSRVTLFRRDGASFLTSMSRNTDPRTFLYIDPPYYSKGNQLYTNYYTDEDHRNVARIMQNISSPWVLTYDDCLPIKRLYRQFNRSKFKLYYSTHRERKQSCELMYYQGISLPCSPWLKR